MGYQPKNLNLINLKEPIEFQYEIIQITPSNSNTNIVDIAM